jgi:hypothetical protein
MHRTTSVFATLLSITMASAGFAQTTQQTSPGSIVTGTTGLASGTKVTVTMVDSITTLNLGAVYSATVASGLVGSNANVAAGTPAVVKVVANTVYPTTYSVALASLSINGQPTAVNGGQPMLNNAGTAVNNAQNQAGNAVGNAINGLFTPHQKQAPQPRSTANRTPSVNGTRIFVPSGSSVVFTLTSAVPGTQTAAAQQTGATPAAGSGAAGPSSTTVVYEQIQYQLTGCQRQSPHIVCQVTVTNLRGGDAMLNGAGGAYYIDQSGNRVNASMRSLANCAGWGACQLLPNIAMAGRWEFIDQDNHATTLVRLQIAEDGKPVAQFTSVPVN